MIPAANLVAAPPLTCSAARRSRRTTTLKTDTTQQKNKISFGKNKELSWHCVEGCGACCKLQKGPSYPSPEEIFTNTSDVEVRFLTSTFLLSKLSHAKNNPSSFKVLLVN